MYFGRAPSDAITQKKFGHHAIEEWEWRTLPNFHGVTGFILPVWGQLQRRIAHPRSKARMRRLRPARPERFGRALAERRALFMGLDLAKEFDQMAAKHRLASKPPARQAAIS
jgi:hypothetical protein